MTTFKDYLIIYSHRSREALINFKEVALISGIKHDIQAPPMIRFYFLMINKFYLKNLRKNLYFSPNLGKSFFTVLHMIITKEVGHHLNELLLNIISMNIRNNNCHLKIWSPKFYLQLLFSGSIL